MEIQILSQIYEIVSAKKNESTVKNIRDFEKKQLSSFVS